MIFKRELESALDKWSQSKNRKPLVLRGARQVGKTTLVKSFSKSFDRFIFLNLELIEHRRIFESNYSFNELVDAIFFLTNNIRDKKKTLIFVDEIQNSPNAVASLRYFYEERPELFVIAAGSLLESLIDKTISFPVGRVEFLAVRPCSFMEYLNAIDDKLSVDLLRHEKIPEYAHDKLISHFNRYALIGGMPEIINVYSETNDLVALNKIYTNLLVSYRDDVEKYARNASMTNHIRHVINIGMSYAGQRIKFERFGSSNYRSREMGEAFRTLEKAMLLELTYPTTTAVLPIIPDFKKSPRLSWIDTGLVNFAAGVQKDMFGSKDISNVWRGVIAEHIVGQELLAMESSVLAKNAFWVREAKNSNAEIDFIYQFNNQIVPIEVKSGAGSRLKSLHLFMDTVSHNIAIRIWSSPYSIDLIKSISGKEVKLINIPFYLIHKLPAILQRNINE